ncbi:DUF7344 domain-containing protein [Halococcus thailandensis]|uniref:DUF7344 domain-containing protein n=1 Tax=Halococcus thailandensis JCM 13552 TaxID=1227457 RepID=M0MY59_9EURY|nr:hypothetical protein [Halococcus thailandensis]EMA50258.1 hypothetical protein C451_17205 [Halococcus thailandensis JCM 13552]
MGTATSDPPAEPDVTDGQPSAEPVGADENDRSGRNLSRDALFDVLSNHRRRYALHSLKQHERTANIGDLAEQVAAWENDVPRVDLSAAERKRVYTALQQFHLPKMDSAGVIEFDDARGTVSLTAAADGLDVYLDVVGEDDIPWSRYYLGLSAMALAGVGGVWLTGFELVPELAWAALVAGVVFLSALVHSYYDRRMQLGAADTPPDAPER